MDITIWDGIIVGAVGGAIAGFSFWGHNKYDLYMLVPVLLL